MRDQHSPENDPEPQDLLDETDDIEISDLVPSKRSHYLLLNLKDAQHRLRTGARQMAQSLASSTSSSPNNGQGAADEPDEFDLEISDLPPGQRSHYLLLRFTALKKHLRTRLLGAASDAPTDRARPPSKRARLGRALTALGLCVSLLILLLGNSPGLRGQLLGVFQTPTTTTSTSSSLSIYPGSRPASNSKVIVRGSSHIDFSVTNSRETPGLLPDTCPQTSTLERFLTPLDPPGIGGGPLWIAGLAGPTAALLDLQPVPHSVIQPPRAFFSWYTTITLFVQKGFPKSILLTGGEQISARALAFGDPKVQTINNQSYQVYLSTTIKDIDNQYTDNGQWEVRALNVFIRAAGCYFLQASWDGGMWLAYFAAGTHY